MTKIALRIIWKQNVIDRQRFRASGSYAIYDLLRFIWITDCQSVIGGLTRGVFWHDIFVSFQWWYGGLKKKKFRLWEIFFVKISFTSQFVRLKWELNAWVQKKFWIFFYDLLTRRCMMKLQTAPQMKKKVNEVAKYPKLTMNEVANAYPKLNQ